MLVTSHMIVPVKKNGKWTTYIKEFQEEIPDLGRHRMMCNKCGDKRYPDCRSWCLIEKDWIEREQKKAQEKIAKHKVEIDILAGLVKDGLLTIRDAAGRVNMAEDEFRDTMKKMV